MTEQPADATEVKTKKAAIGGMSRVCPARDGTAATGNRHHRLKVGGYGYES